MSLSPLSYSYRTNYFFLALVFVFFCLGFYLRSHDLLSSFLLNGDIGRDFLAGFLIDTFHESSLFGHWNSGFNISYPPYYYYFLAALWYIFKKLHFILFFLAFYQSIGIIIIFFISKQIFKSPYPSLLVSFFYAISANFVQISKQPASYTFTIPLFLVVVYFFLKSFSENNKKIFITSLISLAFICQIFGGYIFLFLPLSLYGYFCFREIRIFYIAIFFSVLSYILFSAPIFRSYSFFSLMTSLNDTENVFFRLSSLNPLFWFFSEIKKLFPLYPWLFIFFLIISFVSIIRTSLKIAIVFFVIFLNCFLGLLMKRGEILPHYFYFLQIIFIFGVAYFLKLIGSKSRYARFTLLTLLIISFFSITKGLDYWAYHNDHGVYDSYLALVSYLKSMPGFEDKKISIIDGNTKGWESRSIWLLVQQESKVQIFTLKESNGSITYLNSQTEKKNLVICKFSQTGKRETEYCADFLSSQAKKYARILLPDLFSDTPFTFEIFLES